MNNAVRHQIKARRVQFDFDDTPLHWLRDDPFSTHIINGIHLLLPEGELWFCRVYNQALPLIKDDQLRADVEGFIRQEAVHSRAHSKAQMYLERHGLRVAPFLNKVEWLFGTALADAPFGLTLLKRKPLKKTGWYCVLASSPPSSTSLVCLANGPWITKAGNKTATPPWSTYSSGTWPKK